MTSPAAFKVAQQLRQGREAVYIRNTAAQWCADVDHMLGVGESSHILVEGRVKPIHHTIACHVVKHLHALGFSATWYVEQDGLRVYWGVPPDGQAPCQHHQHALVEE